MRLAAVLAAALVACKVPSHDAEPRDAAPVAVALADATPPADAPGAVDAPDAAACTPLRVLTVHTSVTFDLRITPFASVLRAKGKTRSYVAFHSALEFQDAVAAAPPKHYLPPCNYVGPSGGVPCADFTRCEEPGASDREGFAIEEEPLLACRGKPPALFRWSRGPDGVLDVWQAKEHTWEKLVTLHPKGGCVTRPSGIVEVPRSVNLDE